MLQNAGGDVVDSLFVMLPDTKHIFYLHISMKHLPSNIYAYQNASSETPVDCPPSVGTAFLTNSDP